MKGLDAKFNCQGREGELLELSTQVAYFWKTGRDVLMLVLEKLKGLCTQREKRESRIGSL
jgi:hypothetical protein